MHAKRNRHKVVVLPAQHQPTRRPRPIPPDSVADAPFTITTVAWTPTAWEPPLHPSLERRLSKRRRSVDLSEKGGKFLTLLTS